MNVTYIGLLLEQQSLLLFLSWLVGSFRPMSIGFWKRGIMVQVVEGGQRESCADRLARNDAFVEALRLHGGENLRTGAGSWEPASVVVYYVGHCGEVVPNSVGENQMHLTTCSRAGNSA